MSIDCWVRCQRSVPVGANAGHAYGMYVRRRKENEFRPQQAQPYGQMAIQWLTRESERTGLSIRHQANGREKRIGKLPVDGWCAQTRTAYQFNGCFWHGCPKCHQPEETNPKNNKTMAELLANTKAHTAYLRRHVKVVEMWECAWKRERDPPPRHKWNMTQQQIITAVVNGTLFGSPPSSVPTSPRCSRSLRTRRLLETTSGRSCSNTPKSTTSCRRRAAC